MVETELNLKLVLLSVRAPGQEKIGQWYGRTATLHLHRRTWLL